MLLREIYEEQIKLIDELEEIATTNVALAREWMEAAEEVTSEGMQDVYEILSVAEKAMAMADKIRKGIAEEALSKTA